MTLSELDARTTRHKLDLAPSEAVRCVSSGDRVVFAHACGEPQSLVAALVARADDLRDVEIVHMVARASAMYCGPGVE